MVIAKERTMPNHETTAYFPLVNGEHWPLDVAAGALIGLASEALGSQLLPHPVSHK